MTSCWGGNIGKDFNCHPRNEEGLVERSLALVALMDINEGRSTESENDQALQGSSGFLEHFLCEGGGVIKVNKFS